MIKVKIVREGTILCDKLSVFDFDGTLFKSPEKPKGYKGNWWAKKESLGPPNVPQEAPDNFWFLDIVDKAREEIADPKNCVILMTGRIDQFFEDRINELINQKGLNFKHVWLNEFGGDTGQFKIKKIYETLQDNPTIKKVEMWEDEPSKVDLYKQEFADKEFEFKLNKVGNTPRREKRA
jgi:hypothetical protein